MYQLSGGFWDCKPKFTLNANTTVAFHSDIVAYLRTIDRDPQFCLKIIGALPKVLTEKYYQERNKMNYEIPMS
jgi:hypothetical protein